MDAPNEFEIIYKGTVIKVNRVVIGTQKLFNVHLRTPVVITRADDFNGGKFWTSIPEGKQNIAQELGPLIEAFYRSLN